AALEPVFQCAAEQVEEARIEHDARRVAMREAHQVGGAKSLRRGVTVMRGRLGRGLRAGRDETRHALTHLPGDRNGASGLERDDRDLVAKPQPLLALHAPADREDGRAAAERLDAQLQVKRLAQTACLEKIDLGVDERRPQSAAEVVILEREGEPRFEPVLDDLVCHLEEAREVHDARRVAIGESYAAGKREDLRQSVVLGYAGWRRAVISARRPGATPSGPP